MYRRKLQELNLLDDFLFFMMVNHPEIGEEFSRNLLKIIFRREPGLNYKEEHIKTLPRRVRFYHSKIDAGSLKSGTDYKALKRVVVVMIMPFDPFGFDHMVYTIGNACKEVPELQYDDGAKTVFLYTKGKKGNLSQELREFLHYMEDTRLENAKNDTLKRIHSMVENVKWDREVSIEYMKIFEREQMLIEQGREEEQANTERERKRADEAEERAGKAEEEVERLRELLHKNGFEI